MASLAEIRQLYDTRGARHYGEGVTQVEHAVQCAALAGAAGAAPGSIVAALLHDIGHLLEDEDAADGPDRRHEAIGSAALARLFGPEVRAPIVLHVAAKRYLCATEPGYAARLSRASILSLAVQGGPMSDEDVSRFEAAPFFAEGVLLRRFDDEAKMVGFAVPDLASYRPLVERLARD